MCGIAGLINFNHQPVERELLKKMLIALEHRGPDQDGAYYDTHVSMGIRRLKVIALDNGAQPSYSNDGQYVLVFNGEIYNYQTLRSKLIAQGFHFNTDSDAEVIVNLYQHYGEAFYQYLDGMFSLAIYDRHQETLLLARDYTGKKPLFYSFQDGVVTFASTLNALLKNTRIRRSINPGALDYYLRFRVVPHDQSIFQDVYKVPAGSALNFSSRGEKLIQYWKVNYQSCVKEQSFEQWLDEIDDDLNQAVAKRLAAEVPVGIMLSGGLDSSLIAAIACKQRGKSLNTFAIGFHETNYNELTYSRRLAQDLGTDHEDYIINRQEAFDTAHSLIAHFGEPFAFPSSIASYFMYRLARKKVTVVLGGDGADELFGGYARYSLVASFPHLSSGEKLPRKVDLTEKNWQSDAFPEFYQALLTDGVGSEMRQQIYSQKMKNSLTEAQHVARCNHYRSELNQEQSQLSAAMEYDFNHWMKEAQLVKIDIASMANSLEVRVPFLDQKVIALASSLPEKFKLHQGQEKYLLHHLAKRYLPDYILHRKKQELAIPLTQWINSSMKTIMTETLTSDRALSRGYFNPDRLRQFCKKMDDSQSYLLWTLYMLEKWHHVFVDHEER